MLSMQAFRDWLSSTDETPDTQQRRMARLSRVSRARIMEIAGDLLWFIWEASKTPRA